MHDVRVGIDRVGCRDRRARHEPCALEAERIEDPLLHVALVRRTRAPLDDLAEKGEGEIRVVPATARSEHLLGLLERSDQLLPGRKVERLPDRSGRLALDPCEMREQASDGCRRGNPVEVRGERIVEPEQVLVAQLHDRGRGERLRDRADPVLVAARHPLAGSRVGHTDRVVPDHLPAAGERRGHPREPVGLRRTEQASELPGEIGRHPAVW